MQQNKLIKSLFFNIYIMPNDVDNLIVEKMQAAYDEFAKHMSELESQGNSLVRESIQQIDKQKIEETLAKIREIASK